MKTIAISLQKGGTGKTSLAVSLAAELSKYGDAVLIDADPQGNASAWIGAEKLEAEFAGVLFKKYPLRQAVTTTGTKGLFLLPSAGLGGELKVFIERAAPAEPFCVQDVISELAEQGYRYTVIDLSPSFGTFEREAVTAANEVITPIMPDPFGIDGLQIFAENLTDARRKMHTQKPAYSKIVVTALDNRIKQHGAILAGLKANTSGQSIYAIPVDQVFRRAQTAQKTIQATGDAKPETLAEIIRLANDVAEVNHNG
jgi:chromosome partitioning protein